MEGLNKVMLIGNLGKDPEIRHLESGVAVASFSIATTETYKDRTTGERKSNTEWHNVTLWRGLAEVAEKYLKKGNPIYVEGKLQTRSWEKDGVTRYTTEIVANRMTMLGGKSGGEGQQQSSEAASSAPSPSPAINMQDTNTDSADDTSDDLPF